MKWTFYDWNERTAREKLAQKEREAILRSRHPTDAKKILISQRRNHKWIAKDCKMILAPS
jgi:hypothetical protein